MTENLESNALLPTPSVSKMSPVSPLNAISRPASYISHASHPGKGRPAAEPQELCEVRELLAVPARLVSGLPVPACLQLRVPGAPVSVVLWTGLLHERRAARGESSPVLADTIVFDGAELDALISACEADRLWHADFLGLCFEKWRRPDVPVRSAELLAGANPEPDAGWSLARVLGRLGIEVETIDFDAEPIARPLHAAA